MTNISFLSEFAPKGLNRFCESLVEGYLAQPANAWSNIFFVLVGMIILILCKRNSHKRFILLGVFTIYLGIASFYYHSTNTLLGATLDIIGMISIAVFAFYINTKRLVKLDNLSFHILIFSSILISLIVIVVFPYLLNIIFITWFMLGLFTQLIIWNKSFKIKDEKFFFAFAGSFLIGFVFWILDVTRIYCYNNNHIIQGHALWHVTSAISVLFLYIYFSEKEKNVN